jgi:MFS superfamily sulfate permease-like transporter
MLRLSAVPFVDSTGVAALETFIDRCRHEGVAVVVTGISRPVLRELVRFGLPARRRAGVVFQRSEERALAAARRLAAPPFEDAADD